MSLRKRRRRKNRAKQARNELLTGLGHLRSATAHAAQGVAESAAPRVDSALVAVGLRKRKPRRWPWVVGTVAAGTAVGIAGALLWRRNNTVDTDPFRDRPQTEELKFEPSPREPRVDQMAGAAAQ